MRGELFCHLSATSGGNIERMCGRMWNKCTEDSVDERAVIRNGTTFALLLSVLISHFPCLRCYAL